ncbi:MAG: medium chain dehydrogenase/reductase family protein [Oligoflexia bacterium]|nr:medium chain dehydrogenase/reductase family protein [Oligoflexia bacterium]
MSPSPIENTIPNERLVITRSGGPGVLRLIQEELPPPGPREVRVRVLVSGVAFGDVLKREGLLPGMPPFPYTPGYDLVGEIESVGHSVSDWQPGRRVAAFVGNGANARYVNVPARLLLPVPQAVSDEEALCLVLNYVTAFQLLRRVARLKAGARILVHGGAGGAGSALLDLARHFGITALATASARKLETVRELGATAIDYRNEDFVARARALDPEGLDAVFDPIGGAHLVSSWRCLGRRGMLVVFGASASLRGGRKELLKTLARIARFKLTPGLRCCRFYGIGMRPHSSPALIRRDLALLLQLAAQGKLHPRVGARLPLSRAIEAHEMMNASPVAGKIILVP